MNRYALTVFIIILCCTFMGCQDGKLFEENFDSHSKGSMALLSSASMGALNQRLQMDQSFNKIAGAISADPHNDENQVLKVSGEGTFDFLIDDYPQDVNKCQLSFSLMASKSSDIGYVSLLNAKGKKATGIDFSDNSITVHHSSKQAPFHEGKKLTFHIVLDTKMKEYSLAIQEGSGPKSYLIENKLFVDNDFDRLTKLEFTMNGTYILDDVHITKL